MAKADDEAEERRREQTASARQARADKRKADAEQRKADPDDAPRSSSSGSSRRDDDFAARVVLGSVLVLSLTGLCVFVATLSDSDDEPVPDEPVPDEPVPDEPVPDEPVPDEPVPDEPVPDPVPLPPPPLPPPPPADQPKPPPPPDADDCWPYELPPHIADQALADVMELMPDKPAPWLEAAGFPFKPSATYYGVAAYRRAQMLSGAWQPANGSDWHPGTGLCPVDVEQCCKIKQPTQNDLIDLVEEAYADSKGNAPPPPDEPAPTFPECDELLTLTDSQTEQVLAAIEPYVEGLTKPEWMSAYSTPADNAWRKFFQTSAIRYAQAYLVKPPRWEPGIDSANWWPGSPDGDCVINEPTQWALWLAVGKMYDDAHGGDA